DFSRTSADSLRRFLLKVEPFVKWLKFTDVSNVSDGLLSDELIAVVGQLNGLKVLPAEDAQLHNINIGDKTLLSIVDAGKEPSCFDVEGCSGITPGGIRAFLEVRRQRAQRLFVHLSQLAHFSNSDRERVKNFSFSHINDWKLSRIVTFCDNSARAFI